MLTGIHVHFYLISIHNIRSTRSGCYLFTLSHAPACPDEDMDETIQASGLLKVSCTVRICLLSVWLACSREGSYDDNSANVVCVVSN